MPNRAQRNNYQSRVINNWRIHEAIEIARLTASQAKSPKMTKKNNHKNQQHNQPR